MLKKGLSIFLGLAICCSFMFSSTTMALEHVEEMDKGDSSRDLISIAEEMQEKQIQTYSSDANTYIEVLSDINGIQEVKFVENDKVDIVTYNKLTGGVYIDGKEIIVEELAANPEIVPLTLGSPFDYKYNNIQLQQQIIQYTVSGLCAVLELAGDFTGNAAWSLASALINKAASAGYAYSSACYAMSYKRMDDSYTFYVKYWDMYWDANYSRFCDSYNQTIYQ